MIQRWSFVIWTVSLAFVVYALLAWGLVRRVFGVFVYTISMSGVHRWKPRPDEDLIFGISPSDFPRHIHVLGLHVPTSAFVAAFITIQLIPFAVAFGNWHRRRTRDRLGQCLDCGYQLTTHRGRCRGCGVRIGPG